jgi:hypothetical protein
MEGDVWMTADGWMLVLGFLVFFLIGVSVGRSTK